MRIAISRIASIACVLAMLSTVSRVAAQSRGKDLGTLYVGNVIVWVKSTDRQTVQIFASRGYRDALARPYVVNVDSLDQWADSAEAILRYRAPESRENVEHRTQSIILAAPELAGGDLMLERLVGGPLPGFQLSLGASRTSALFARLTSQHAGQLISLLRDASAATRATLAARGARSMARDGARGPTPVPALASSESPPRGRDSAAIATAPTTSSKERTDSAAKRGAMIAVATLAPLLSKPAAASAQITPRSPERASEPMMTVMATSMKELDALTATSAVTLEELPATVLISGPPSKPLRLRPPSRSAAPAAVTLGRVAGASSVRAGGASPPSRAVATSGGKSTEAGIEPARSTPVAIPAPPPDLVQRLARKPTPARARQAQLQFCYGEYGLKSNPRLAGTLAISVELGVGGEVTQAQVALRTWKGPEATEVEACILDRMKGWRLALTELGTGKQTFTYSFAQ